MVAKKMKQQTAAEKAVHNATAAERRGRKISCQARGKAGRKTEALG
jgi:hypothetical protein